MLIDPTEPVFWHSLLKKVFVSSYKQQFNGSRYELLAKYIFVIFVALYGKYYLSLKVTYKNLN